MKTYLKAIRKRRVIVVAYAAIFLLLALGASFLQPLKYRATSRLLVLQQNLNPDPYAIAKANQYIGSLLRETIYSGSFFEQVSSSNQQVDWGYFRGTYKQQIKLWKKTITVRPIGDTGIIQVEIYHPDPEQAKQLAITVDNLLVTADNLYQNTNQRLTARIIDQPTLSSFPVKPNLLVNGLSGLIFGIIVGLVYIYYKPVSSRARERHLLREMRLRETRHYPIPDPSPSSMRQEGLAYDARRRPHEVVAPEPEPRPIKDEEEIPLEETPQEIDMKEEHPVDNWSLRGNIHNIVNERF